MKLEIFNQNDFNEAVRKDWFEAATTVRLWNMPRITTKPRLAPHGRVYRNGSEWK